MQEKNMYQYTEKIAKKSQWTSNTGISNILNGYQAKKCCLHMKSEDQNNCQCN
jgi:hypothetical protein